MYSKTHLERYPGTYSQTHSKTYPGTYSEKHLEKHSEKTLKNVCQNKECTA